MGEIGHRRRAWPADCSLGGRPTTSQGNGRNRGDVQGRGHALQGRVALALRDAEIVGGRGPFLNPSCDKLSLGLGFLKRTEGAPPALAVEVENQSVAGAAAHLTLVDRHHRAATLDPDDGGTRFPGIEPKFCHAFVMHDGGGGNASPLGSANPLIFKVGAGGRTRTDTSSRTQDFESSASTNFTTPAGAASS
jgi:hypothetical protein